MGAVVGSPWRPKEARTLEKPVIPTPLTIQLDGVKVNTIWVSHLVLTSVAYEQGLWLHPVKAFLGWLIGET